MNNQKKKKMLLKYQTAVREADRLEEEIQRWRSIAERTTGFMKLVPAGSDAGRSLETAVEQINELAGQLGKRRQAAVQLRQTVETAIDGVEDEQLRDLLRMRYIDDITWEQIAVTMDKSYRWACKLHGDALQEISFSS